MKTLPIPSINYFPKVFTEKNADSTLALTNKLDIHINEWLQGVLNLRYLCDIDRCPSQFLDRLGYMVNANLFQQDSDTTKRQKIYNAIPSHKISGSFNNDIKLAIDAITGLSALIYRSSEADDGIECGDGYIETGTDWYVEGGDGESPFGTLEIGNGREIEIQGNIYINLGGTESVPTASQITQIVDFLIKKVPAYFRIYLGYISSFVMRDADEYCEFGDGVLELVDLDFGIEGGDGEYPYGMAEVGAEAEGYFTTYTGGIIE